ncbi:hypothetical protein SAMN04487910_4052 [Aquimarina amphilecti]|uniref:Uncharacterized protein n=1 Tax=Aquimarina amphilecti TaxID=1038014 RepID=A0A1H7VEC5_AQUAM|nr:hypothetical protein [Aquimarina amphilecti]SEM07208.1 hypothetical protein SAMN04487910_4052 [Aquimarina amphilecti]
MNKIICYLLFVLIVACNKEDKISEEIILEVKSLVTNDQKIAFLEKIHRQDQKVRKALNEVELEFGYDSNEKEKAIQQMIKNDRANLQKIELYLQEYGHPSKDTLGELAAGTPWIVIHHSGSIESRQRNFAYLYKAYINEDLKPGSFSFYLERFHKLKYGNRFTLPNPYRQEQLIDSLIKRLDLSELTE